MLFSSPQYPLFLAAVFFLYGLARTGRWPASIARVALMLLLADVVYVLLTHDVGTLWDPVEEPSQRLEQVWFAGAHANVGGGYADNQLSDIPLLWMLDRAV